MSPTATPPSRSSLHGASPALHQRQLERLPLHELLGLLGVSLQQALLAGGEPVGRLGASAHGEVATAARAAFELARRLAQQRDSLERLASPESVAAYLRPQLAHLLFERFVVLSFNPVNALLSHDVVAEGSADSCVVDPRLVFDVALRAGASAIILAHNHPSGSAEPSVSDVSLSCRLVSVGRALGVPVLDSLVITRHGHTSLTSRGLLHGECSPAEVG
jgi:DNA repair protein RadC